MPPGAPESGRNAEISKHGLFVILPSGLIGLTDNLPGVTATQTQETGGSLPAVPFWMSVYVFVSAFLASGLFLITPVQLPFYLRNACDASLFEMGAAIAVWSTIGMLLVSLGVLYTGPAKLGRKLAVST